MKKLICSIIIIALFPTLALAETVQITETSSLIFELPDGWQLTTEPPQALVAEMAEHIGHEAAEKGYSPTQAQLMAAAIKRLKANEVLLYNPESTAFITLDMSHLRQGERPPSKKSIKLSAKYAGQSLEQEEGVSQLQDTSNETTINGAWYAYRYDADFLQHDKNKHFSGIIGFSAPHWFFFYATDYLKDSNDRQKIEKIFESIRIDSK